MKEKKPEDYLIETLQYNFVCSECKMRHPSKLEKCFACGKFNTIVFEKNTTKHKKKDSVRGATLKINF